VHLTIILDRLGQLQAARNSAAADAEEADEATEGWTSNSPGYSSLIAKRDSIADKIKNFNSELASDMAEFRGIAGI
jgi:hypothetical protein